MIPFSSAMERTMKFGALPMYVFAPMNTAPQEIAIRKHQLGEAEAALINAPEAEFRFHSGVPMVAA